jgi:hypothetical protein
MPSRNERREQVGSSLVVATGRTRHEQWGGDPGKPYLDPNIRNLILFAPNLILVVIVIICFALLQVPYTKGTTVFESEVYTSEYLEFHRPSEHFVSSKQFDLELQVYHVHQTDPSKRLVVVVMFVLGSFDNSFLEELDFTDLPGRAGDSKSLSAPFNPEHGMPMSGEYYVYDGSLTAPPCTEGVKFVVLNERPYASGKQVFMTLSLQPLSPTLYSHPARMYTLYLPNR